MSHIKLTTVCLLSELVIKCTLYHCLYVNEILVAESDLDEVERIKRQFTEHYEMKDLGELNYYLGMKFTRSEECIKIDQSGYIREILEKYSHLLRGKEGKTVNDDRKYK